MTKKYDTLAASFGYNLRTLEDAKKTATTKDDSIYYETAIAGYWTAVSTYEQIAQQENPRFDKVRFHDFVIEVQLGSRDINGKKVTNKKKAA